ncbi:hypothetical protein AOLI_G00083230 [Acnodon oligacanthus]
MTSTNAANSNSLKLEKAEEIWQRVRSKVVLRLFGPSVSAVLFLQDAHLFQPLCVIGERVECSLFTGKVRTLFHLGPLCNLMDHPSDPPVSIGVSDSLQREDVVHCDFFHEEFLKGVGRVLVQVKDFYKESQALPMTPPQVLVLKDSLPWLDSVQRLYLLTKVFRSSTCRLWLLEGERKVKLHLKANTPLAFACLRLSVSPSGQVELNCKREGRHLHPCARWVHYGSADYNQLLEGIPSEFKVKHHPSHFAFSISHPSMLFQPGPAAGFSRAQKEEQEKAQCTAEYKHERDYSEQALLPLHEEDS